MRVSVGAIVEGGRVLVSRRKAGVHKAGLWEFPGGKQEPGESPRQALERELEEELGIRVTRARPLIQVPWEYPGVSVTLDVWRVDGFEGEARGREGQPVEWVAIERLDEYAFPEANVPIVRALQLPASYAITPDCEDPKRFSELATRLLSSGVSLLQLRAPRLQDADFRRLAGELAEQARSHGPSRGGPVRVLLNSDLPTACDLGASGVHLSSRRLMSMDVLVRDALPPGFLLAASCHNRGELRQAVRLGLDFVVLSAVHKTRSHPGARVLGWTGFEGLVRELPMPVFALGGMRLADQQASWRYGAQGVAGISMFE